MTIPPPGFTGSPLDRVESERIDPDALARLALDPRALLLDLDGYQPLFDDMGALSWSRLALTFPIEELIFLGRIDGTPRFARMAPQGARAMRGPQLFALLDSLPAGEAATYGTARSLIDWHARHRFCANCGTATGLHRNGWGRACPACHAEHFPRVDPVVIMLSEHGEGDTARVLVGRQPAFPPGRYSALAGFVEVGESIEEAVRRELFEEAGVCAGAVRYIASQPWPFPSQLMIACIAKVDDPTIVLDGAELEDAIWVDRAQIGAAMAGAEGAPFLTPPRYAVAATLMQAWLDGY